MKCPECGKEVEVERFCPYCGVKLTDDQAGSGGVADDLAGLTKTVAMPVTAPNPATEPVPVPTTSSGVSSPSDGGSEGEASGKTLRRRKWPIFAAAAVLVACAVGIGFFLSHRETISDIHMNEVVTNEGMSLYADTSHLFVGEDGKVHMRLHIPAGFSYSGDVDILDENGNVVLTIKEADLIENPDGSKDGEGDFDIDTGNPGRHDYRPDDGGGDDNDNGGHGETSMYVTPKLTEDQIRECLDVVGDTCAWINDTYGSGGNYVAQADGVVGHLEGDERVGSAKRYDDSIFFATKSDVLGQIHLAGIDEVTLGTRDSSFASTGTIIDAFSIADGGEVDGSTMLSAGNVQTNNKVLVLAGAPDLMSSDDLAIIQSASEGLASALDGSADYVDGDQVLASVLDGSLSGYGTIALVCHGMAVGGDSDTATLFQLTSAGASGSKSWTDSSQETFGAIAAAANGGSDVRDAVFSYFFGNPAEPGGWRGVLYGEPLREEGWIEGVRITPEAVSSSASKPFDNAVLFLGACDSLSDSSFNAWASSHGVSLLAGYDGQVTQRANADNVASLFGYLGSHGEAAWRTMTADEAASEGSVHRGSGLTIMSSDEGEMLSCVGNGQLFYRGKGSLSGRIVSGDEPDAEAVDGAKITAYRLLNRRFEKEAATTSDKGGGFSFDDLECGAYVLEVSDNEGHTSYASIVFDVETLDGGKVVLTVASAEGAYLKKVEEIVERYGENEVESLPNGTNGSLQQAKGLALAQLIDFNEDGRDELIVAYYDSASDRMQSELADAQAYHIELWGYIDGELRKLHEGAANYTNGGFAYFMLYQREQGLALATVDHVDDGSLDGGVVTALWMIDDNGKVYKEKTFSIVGETPEPNFEIDGVPVDSSTYWTRYNELDDLGSTTYSLMSTGADPYNHVYAQSGGRISTIEPSDMSSITDNTISYLRVNATSITSAERDATVSYQGTYGFVDGTASSGSFALLVGRQIGGHIEFAVVYTGRNGSPYYDTGVIEAEVKDGVANFNWSDSWENEGTGTLVFGDDRVSVSMTETKTATSNRATLSGDRVLPKLYDSVEDADFFGW